jgi:hypothetical protein
MAQEGVQHRKHECSAQTSSRHTHVGQFMLLDRQRYCAGMCANKCATACADQPASKAPQQNFYSISNA